jgi:hypothetical protein
MHRQQAMFSLGARNDLRIDSVDGALAVVSPYNPHFVDALKLVIPSTDRKWDGGRKVWLVSPAYGSQLQRLIEQHYSETVALPEATGRAPLNEMRLLDVRYIGAAKSREDGTETAYGWSAGQWSVIFPKPVLLEWFGQTQRPGESPTLYGVLGVSQNVDAIELKKAWRRLIMQWHPDRAKEPGAKEQFQAIQEAYEVLSSPQKRGKYNAGLQFEAASKAHTPRHTVSQNEWRSPLRCGLILVEGQSRLGRFVVSKIAAWQDIVNSKGETLITTWGAGEDNFTEAWVI